MQSEYVNASELEIGDTILSEGEMVVDVVIKNREVRPYEVWLANEDFYAFDQDEQVLKWSS